ncbi:hypothetical protein PaeBR_16010 [Paenibacillus sp. BR2-3]|uniref:hypothetical protein n=1 Tax=Paenibacillus sp. BR2-3 TaxID=3048494 RepID=UPI003977CA55
MRKNVKRIITLTAAVLFSLSPAAGFTGHAGAEQATPSPAPDSLSSARCHEHHHGKDGRFHSGGHFIMMETSRLLEMECSSLKESLKAGKTLPELALEKKGWTEEQYVQKLSEAAVRNLDQAVAEGRLSDAEAKKLKERLPAMLKLKISKMGKFHE